ncbi:hypothetical protein K9N68_17820 [Kovacikia minuta CCNUW1]|uniref:hypothetical protein n=1 Tax=Kovacikia minuta TaxID=2931930 RepID=UPI001CC9E4CD|nr:hypothetical protein [Kovacikia minuta]UBF23634.1 hypothetical protein K9N68_17820 [Kovacikia minuta CCNUW1]
MMKRMILGSLATVLLGILSAPVADAQIPNTPGTPQPPRGTGNYLRYPPGTQIYQNGAIVTPDGLVTYPNGAMPGREGSTTYYYPNGTRITIKKRIFNHTSGLYLTPGTVNGGVRSNANSNSTGSFFVPGGLGRLPRNRVDRAVGRCQLPGVNCQVPSFRY